MAEQTTLVIVLPHAVKGKQVNPIIIRFLAQGLEIIKSELRNINAAQAEKLCAKDTNKEQLVTNLTSGLCMIMQIRGEEAIRRVWDLKGPPIDAPRGTINGDHPSLSPLIRASSDEDSAKLESRILFGY
ncbi:MAG TPA: nucleoside-diphosphate kinase [Candidatus Paceibacterota bacterium]|nr:nucleoside-diphosphate kinase [Candidatus Paceibacterota bacterium]